MPQKTKAEIQASLATIMEYLFSASAALDEGPVSDEEMADGDSEDIDGDDVAEILFLAGVESMEDVYAMSVDGSRGPYGQIPKSKGWFKAALQSPDRDFCRTFR